MNTKKIIAALFLVAVLVGGFLIFKKNQGRKKTTAPVSTASDEKPFRIGLVSQAEDLNLVFDFAQDKGFFQKENIKITKVISENDIANVLFAGGTDAIIAGNTASLTAFLNKADARELATLFHSFTHFGISRFSKNEVMNIKKVGVHSMKGEAYMVAMEALRNIGVDSQKVEMVQVPTDTAMNEMLSRGEIDFAVFSSAKLVYDVNAYQKYTVYEPSDILNDSDLVRSLITTQATLDARSADLEKVTRAFHETLQYMDNNPKEIVAYIQKDGASEDRARKIYAGYINSRQGLGFVPDELSTQRIADLVKKDFKLESDRNVADFIDSDFAQKLQNAK